MSSIVTMIHRNKPTYIEGTLPHLGSRLNVKWKAFIAILICIVATHFTIFTLTYFVTQRLR